MERVAAGEDPKGIIRDPRGNVRVALPVAGREGIEKGYTREQIRANPRLRRLATFQPPERLLDAAPADIPPAVPETVAAWQGSTS